jgi:hypothetical protein
MPVIKIVELNGEVVFQPDDPRHCSGRRWIFKIPLKRRG